jgi:hypothetical protein
MRQSEPRGERTNRQSRSQHIYVELIDASAPIWPALIGAAVTAAPAVSPGVLLLALLVLSDIAISLALFATLGV